MFFRCLIWFLPVLLAACAAEGLQDHLSSSVVEPAPASISQMTVLPDPIVTQTAPAAQPAPATLAPPTPGTAERTATSTQAPAETDEPEPTPLSETSLLFTGVIVPARCVQAAIDARGDSNYLFARVRDLISQADLAIGTLNATISDYPPHTGCVFTYVLVGSSSNADAMAAAGFDVMSVATNHIKNCGLSNCGDRAFFDTLENLKRVGISPVGAGANLAEASRPVVKIVNGIRFGIVSLGQIEPMAFAGENSPGIAVLTEESLREAVAAARQVSDVVIAMPHWGPEDVPNPNWSQRNLARVAVEAGADLIVGNHTHVVQAIQEIDGVPVFYGLGNFVFDQTWASDHMQGVILRLKFEGQRYLGYELIPTHVDGDGTVRLAGADEAAEILNRIWDASELLGEPPAMLTPMAP
jgi:Bacterial capsule synthesis protein PGA_cap